MYAAPNRKPWARLRHSAIASGKDTAMVGALPSPHAAIPSTRPATTAKRSWLRRYRRLKEVSPHP